MRIVISKPSMSEAKHWASIVTDVMVESGKFDFVKAEARRDEIGPEIVLHFAQAGRST